MKIGLVTCSKEPDLTIIDQELIPLFQSHGIVALPLIWNDPTVKWTDFDHLILRSSWDYHLLSQDFLKWLELLDKLKVPLLNPTAIVRKNHHKFYLKKLHNSGIKIVPTLFINKTDHLKLDEVQQTNWNKAVIKPAISASSFLTEIFDTHEIKKIENKYRLLAKERDFLVQQFMPEVRTFGELSILFFNRKYSHTVVKTATSNEFRVQEEFGGKTKRYNPSQSIIDQASGILSEFEGDILQARVDGVVRDGQFKLMELELIEPHLFFEHNSASAAMFVKEAAHLMQPSDFTLTKPCN